jgi:phenylpropionate dioxygenase-like ring-hydroxylating dioxygenase large terminal subunit
MSVYPFLIGCVEDFDNSKPHKLTILGKSYVVWVDKSKTVNILPDACPHLGGALSRGSLVDNNNKVQCPFHVQQFDGQGNLNGVKGKCYVDVPYFKVVNGLIWFGPQEFDEDVIPNFEFLNNPDVHFAASAPGRVVNSQFRKLLGIGYDVNHAAGTHREFIGIDRVTLEDKNVNGGGDYFFKINLFSKTFSFIEKLSRPFLFFIKVDKVSNDVFSFFPTLFLARNVSKLGTAYSLFYFFPQDENTSVAGGLYFSNVPKIMDKLFKKSSIKVLNTIIDQDMFETQAQYDVSPAFDLPYDDVRHDVVTQWLASANMMTEESRLNRKNLIVK